MKTIKVALTIWVPDGTSTCDIEQKIYLVVNEYCKNTSDNPDYAHFHMKITYENGSTLKKM